MPLVSIIIPTYNRKNFVIKTIDSLLKQESDDYELIIVDDGSSDGTDEHFKNFANPKVSYHKIGNSERGFARNYGARQAKGSYVNFFDSDDLAYNNHVSNAVNFIKLKDNPEVFHEDYDIKTPEGDDVPFTRISDSEIGKWLVDHGNVLSCNGVFIRKDIALQFPFCESRILSGTEDYALWLRLSSRFKIWRVPGITSTIVNHEQRSMASHDVVKLINRNMFLLDYLQNDNHFMDYIGDNFNLIESECFSYIALHIVLAGNNRQGFNFLMKAMKADRTFPFRSVRFMAIIKHMGRNFFGRNHTSLVEAG